MKWHMVCLFHYIVDGTLKLYSVSRDKQLHSCSPSSMVSFVWFFYFVFLCVVILLPLLLILLLFCVHLVYVSADIVHRHYAWSTNCHCW